MFSPAQLRGSDLGYVDGEYSLTFDDGPTPGITENVARMLFEKGIQATFFILGQRAQADQLNQIAEHGHTLGNHTFSHPNLAQFDGAACDEITRCHDLVKDFATDRIPFRAPYGNWTAECNAAGNSLKFAGQYTGPYHWDINADDWRMNRRPGHPHKITFDQFCSFFRAINKQRRSGIILLHDGFADCEAEHADVKEIQILRVLEFVIDEITRQGFRFVPLRAPPENRNVWVPLDPRRTDQFLVR